MDPIMLFLVTVAVIDSTLGYAQLGETMNCVDEDCSETISEGKAKLAYQPRDKKFLNLRKGDVVLVKGKKAGSKTDLWGGQKFLDELTDDEELSTLSTADQKIMIQRNKNKESKNKGEVDETNEMVDKEESEISSTNVKVEDAVTVKDNPGKEIDSKTKADSNSASQTQSGGDNDLLRDLDMGSHGKLDESLILVPAGHDEAPTQRDIVAHSENTAGIDPTSQSLQNDIFKKVSSSDRTSYPPTDPTRNDPAAVDDIIISAVEESLSKAMPRGNGSNEDNANSQLENRQHDSVSPVEGSSHSSDSEILSTEKLLDEKEPELSETILTTKISSSENAESTKTIEVPKEVFEDESLRKIAQASSGDSDIADQALSELHQESSDSDILTPDAGLTDYMSVVKQNLAVALTAAVNKDLEEDELAVADIETNDESGNKEISATTEQNDNSISSNKHYNSASESGESESAELSKDFSNSQNETDGDKDDYEETPTSAGSTLSVNVKEDNTSLQNDLRATDTSEMSDPGQEESLSLIESSVIPHSEEEEISGPHQTQEEEISGPHQPREEEIIDSTIPAAPVEDKRDTSVVKDHTNEGNTNTKSNDHLVPTSKSDTGETQINDKNLDNLEANVGAVIDSSLSEKADSNLADGDHISPNKGLDKPTADERKEDESRDVLERQDCSVDQHKRIQCGMSHSTKAFCQALQCCWSPNALPSCYFSSSQMLTKEKATLEEINSDEDEKQEKEEPTLLPQPDSYDQVHEGKVVNWDESFQEKPEEKSSLWDEELGETNGDAIELSTLDKSDQGLLGESSTNQQPIEFKPPDTGEAATTTVSSSLPKESISETTLPTPPFIVGNHSSENKTAEKNYEEETEEDLSVGDLDARPTSIEEQTEDYEATVTHEDTPPVDDESAHPNSTIVTLVYLFGRLPSDVMYTLTPLGLWWLALLPDEFQNDVYGVSWPIIILTVIVGFCLTWIIMWRSNVSKHIQREQNLLSNSEELRGQLKTLMDEKLEKEKDLQDIQIKLEETNFSFDEEKATRLKTYEEVCMLKKTLKTLEMEKQQRNDEINKITLQLKTSDKEKSQLLNKSKQTEKSLEDRKTAHIECEKNLNKLHKELKESRTQNQKLETEIKDFQVRLNKREKREEKDKEKMHEWEDRASELKKQIKMLEEKVAAMTDDNASTKQEADVLKDCLLQFKGVQAALTDEGDEDLDHDEVIEKQKEKLQVLIDVSQMQKKVKQIEVEKGRVMFELEAERKSREETEARVGELEAECENAKAVRQKTERELQIQQAKLNVMQDFYAKREIEMQGKLGKEQSVREMNESRIAEQGDETNQLAEQLEVYKKMNDEAKRHFDESEKQRKNEISLYEKKAHSNWLASREAERKLDEANREMAQLRLELNELQLRLSEAERREPPLIRPRPGPPPGGPFPGPRLLPDVGSPLPFRNGPPFREGSPPVRLSGRRSPVGSIQDDNRRPDRPPSHRPPSRDLPRSGSMEFGDGRMFVEFDRPPFDYIPRREGPPSLHEDMVRDGPPPIREPLLPRNTGPPFARDRPPQRFGPPPLRGGLRPIMHGDQPAAGDMPPPFINDGPPPPVRHGSPYIRDGPPPMRDGPPPMRNGPSPMLDGIPLMISGRPMPLAGDNPPLEGVPPAMYDVVSPERDGFAPHIHRPGQGPLTSSPYMERPMHPPRNPSGRPQPMSLHGNLPPPPQARRNERDLHPQRMGP